jgi:hypothetical protein
MLGWYGFILQLGMYYTTIYLLNIGISLAYLYNIGETPCLVLVVLLLKVGSRTFSWYSAVQHWGAV